MTWWCHPTCVIKYIVIANKNDSWQQTNFSYIITHYTILVCLLVHFFLAFSLEVVVGFVDISWILYQHCLKFLFDNSVRHSELTIKQSDLNDISFDHLCLTNNDFKAPWIGFCSFGTINSSLSNTPTYLYVHRRDIQSYTTTCWSFQAWTVCWPW